MAARFNPFTDNIQKPAKPPGYLLGEVTQPSESRLSETRKFVEQYEWGSSVECWVHMAISGRLTAGVRGLCPMSTLLHTLLPFTIFGQVQRSSATIQTGANTARQVASSCRKTSTWRCAHISSTRSPNWMTGSLLRPNGTTRRRLGAKVWRHIIHRNYFVLKRDSFVMRNYISPAYGPSALT